MPLPLGLQGGPAGRSSSAPSSRWAGSTPRLLCSCKPVAQGRPHSLRNHSHSPLPPPRQVEVLVEIGAGQWCSKAKGRNKFDVLCVLEVIK